MLEVSLHSGKPLESYEQYDQEILFTYGRKAYPTEPKGDTREAVRKVL